MKYPTLNGITPATILTIIVIAILLAFQLTTASVAQANQALVERDDVQAYINDFSQSHHVPKAELEQLFQQVVPRPQVIHKIKHPAEAMTWGKYKHLFITQSKIMHGAEFWHEHQAILAQAEQEFQVPASIIVATLGIESNYGQHQGKFKVLDALVNLAFNYSNRSKFFKYELTEFLIMTLVEQQQDPTAVLGSYAGAVGMVQFMPHSYRQLAVDYSHTGSIDLTADTADAIGSIANYYHHFHWHYYQPIASRANTKQLSKLKANQVYSSQILAKHGYTNSTSWPKNIDQADLIDLPLANQGSEYWLAYPNFQVIEKYNASPLYAMAVYQLSRKIEDYYQKTYNSAN